MELDERIKTTEGVINAALAILTTIRVAIDSARADEAHQQRLRDESPRAQEEQARLDSARDLSHAWRKGRK